MQITREQFLERRRSGIGGSDIAAIVGMSPWKTPRAVWLEKKGIVKEEPQYAEALYWGTTLEDVVAREYSRRTGRKVCRCNFLFRATQRPFLLGDIDRAVYDSPDRLPVVKGEYRAHRLLECKTASQYASGDWGETGSSDIPEHYKAQVMWYMGLTGASYADVAVLIGGKDFRMYEIPRDEDVVHWLQDEGTKFWRDYVEADVMPPAVSLDDVERNFQGAKGLRTFAPDATVADVERYAALDAQAKALKSEMDALKVQICDAMGDATELAAPDGRKLCTWSAAAPSQKTDWKAVAEEMGATSDVIAAHTEQGLTARRFTLAKAK